MKTETHTRDLAALPRGYFAVVYLDPPWSHYGDPNKDAAAGKHYELMTPETIHALPVKALMAGPRSVCLCWATGPRLDAAIDAIRAWGLCYRGVTKVWVKTRQDGGIISGQGVRPTITKPTTEFLLAATWKQRGRPLPLLDEGAAQVMLAPRGRHSEKPAQTRDDIVALFGDVPRLEMFARVVTPGWSAWGNEVPNE